MLLREQIRADLIVLDFRYFDAGMDWLSAYHARVDCFRKIVTQHLVNHRLNLLGVCDEYPARISAIHATPLLVAQGTWLSFRRAECSGP